MRSRPGLERDFSVTFHLPFNDTRVSQPRQELYVRRQAIHLAPPAESVVLLWIWGVMNSAGGLTGVGYL